jgi:hypothetical protein
MIRTLVFLGIFCYFGGKLLEAILEYLESRD